MGLQELMLIGDL